MFADVGFLFLVVLLAGGVWVGLKFEKTRSLAPPRSSEEVDAALIAKYQKEVARYQRKLAAFRNSANVGRSFGVNNPALSIPPKPPKPPVLSSQRRN